MINKKGFNQLTTVVILLIIMTIIIGINLKINNNKMENYINYSKSLTKYFNMKNNNEKLYTQITKIIKDEKIISNMNLIQSNKDLKNILYLNLDINNLNQDEKFDAIKINDYYLLKINSRNNNEYHLIDRDQKLLTIIKTDANNNITMENMK